MDQTQEEDTALEMSVCVYSSDILIIVCFRLTIGDCWYLTVFDP